MLMHTYRSSYLDFRKNPMHVALMGFGHFRAPSTREDVVRAQHLIKDRLIPAPAFLQATPDNGFILFR
jgi:hypothetical protein